MLVDAIDITLEDTQNLEAQLTKTKDLQQEIRIRRDLARNYLELEEPKKAETQYIILIAIDKPREEEYTEGLNQLFDERIAKQGNLHIELYRRYGNDGD